MIDLDILAYDLAEVLSGDEYGIDVAGVDVRRALVPFLETIAPGTLTAEQRIGLDLPQEA